MRAAALGALQGPAELFPVSSSGHLVLVPAMLGWPYGDLDPELRKSFEVALHGGTAIGLLLALRRDAAAAVRSLDLRAAGSLALTFLPAAVAGLALERPIESRLGDPRLVALAQITAGAALIAADRRPAARAARELRARDALALGFAQASALAPGVSRGGAVLTAARALRFDRAASGSLARRAALPVIAGAVALKGARLARRGLPPELRAPFVCGAAAALATAAAAAPLAVALDRARSYAPVAGYRIALGAAALALLTRRRTRAGAPRVPRRTAASSAPDPPAKAVELER